MQRNTHTHSHTHPPSQTLARLQNARMGSVPLSHLLVRPPPAASVHETHTSSSLRRHTRMLTNTLPHSRTHGNTLMTELAHKGKAHQLTRFRRPTHEPAENKEHIVSHPCSPRHPSSRTHTATNGPQFPLARTP